MTACLLLALLGAAAGGVSASPAGERAIVLVAVPANATGAMTEALNRLRGEATAVGFEVRILDAQTDTPSLAQLEALSAGLAPAAVVAISHPGDGEHAPHALDVWFQDRGSGKAQLAHLDAGDVADAPERADVVVAAGLSPLASPRLVPSCAANP